MIQLQVERIHLLSNAALG